MCVVLYTPRNNKRMTCHAVMVHHFVHEVDWVFLILLGVRFVIPFEEDPAELVHQFKVSWLPLNPGFAKNPDFCLSYRPF